MPPRPLFWLALIGLFAALLAAAPARAGGAMVGQSLAVCVAPARADMTAKHVLTTPVGFDCTTPQTRFGPGDYWIVSTAVPASVKGGVPLGVRTASLWQRSVTLYALYPDGRIVTRRMDDAEAARHVQLGAILQQRLPYHAAAPVRLAWRVEGAANLRGILVAPHIATPAESARGNLTMAAAYAAFAGLIAALLIHNLAMWRVLRQRFQLWYLAMLVAVLTYVFSASGALAWAWPDLPNTARLRINYLTLALTGIAAMRFARSFFEPRVMASWLGRLIDVASVALLAAATLFAVAAPWQIAWLDRLYNFAFMGLLAVVAPMMWRAWCERSDYLWLFAAAWAAPVTLAAVRIAHNFGFVRWTFWIDNSTFLGTAAEALGASLAIAYRIRQLARDRDIARAEELAARLLADTDPLTGVLNRRAFLAQAIGRVGDQTLLIMDLDRFKSVNDTIGHDGGDEVLRRVARILRAACPPEGLVTRLGGEEFAMLCPVAQSVSADALLARLRGTPMPFDLTVTGSVGGCTGPLMSEKDWKVLYGTADRALYAAKSGGRDRARVIGAPQPLAA